MKQVIPYMLIVTVLFGCLPTEESRDKYVVLERPVKEVLPIAPHVKEVKARPTEAMAAESKGKKLLFRVLDKQTGKVFPLYPATGGVVEGPWNGSLEVMAYMPDLLINEQMAEHGPRGHVNPAVWVLIRDQEAKLLFEGWLFTRDPAQTAWDDKRYDLSFVGLKEEGEG